ncbi:MAG: hypothetical protein NUW37_02860 [Planctomycetes bacterium]|nr:hypothetical protein [Planctomycetota bacterium]
MTTVNSELLIDHLKKKWRGKPCTLCGASSWGVSDKVYELREFNEGDFKVGNVPIMPLIPVTCDNCGNTILVNAILTGFVDNQVPV